MPTRKIKFVEREYYHIYNRGVDKRDVFSDKKDLQRFLQSIEEFNTKNPIGSLYENSFVKEKELGGRTSKLVKFIALCLNRNHYHFIITPIIENGIEKFMQRLGTGYTMYFNEKHKRNGALFQGKFKGKHIDSNEYLLRVSAYINLNNYSRNGENKKELSFSSWEEYTQANHIKDICDKKIILEQFKSKEEYKKFSLEAWQDACAKKDELNNLEFT